MTRKPFDRFVSGAFALATFVIFGLISSAWVSQAEAKKYSFAKHIYPILKTSCLKCHRPQKKKGKMKPAAGGLDLSRKVAYQNIVDVQSQQASEGYNIVTAGDVTRSYMMYKLLNQHKQPSFGPKVLKTKRMPPKKKLARWRVKRIIQWIREGAKK